MDFYKASSKKYFFWVGVSLVFIFSSLKPAATIDANVLIGILIWTLQIGFLLPILIYLQFFLQRIKTFDALNSWIKLSLVGFISSVLFTPYALFLDYIFALDDWSEMESFTDLYLLFLDEITGILIPVTITWVLINAPYILQLRFDDIQLEKSGIKKSHKHSTKNKTFISQDLMGNVLYLMSELHYVRVVTNEKEQLILYNISDAINEISSVIDGIQIHRSYWVAKNKVDKITRKENQSYCLINQIKLPISRRRLKEVRAYLELHPT